MDDLLFLVEQLISCIESVKLGTKLPLGHLFSDFIPESKHVYPDIFFLWSSMFYILILFLGLLLKEIRIFDCTFLLFLD